MTVPVDTPIEDLNLSVRAYNCLKRNGLVSVGQVLEKSEDELLSMRNLGREAYDDLVDKLIEAGFLPRRPDSPDDGDGPDGPETSGTRIPRRPSPGGLATSVQAEPETETDQLRNTTADPADPAR
jgi:DNA-directed RNA polymerase subunit alpha